MERTRSMPLEAGARECDPSPVGTRSRSRCECSGQSSNLVLHRIS